MTRWTGAAPRLGCLILTIVLITSCAQYSAKTNKASDFTERPLRIFAWSSLCGVTPFTIVLPFAEDTFCNLFNTELSKQLLASGIKNEVNNFTPTVDSATSLARFERSLNPDYRLLVAVPKYTTITVRGGLSSGKPIVDILNLDVSIIRIKDDKRVWRSEIVVNANTAPGTAWREAGAEKLVAQIVGALKADGVL